VRLLDLFCGAGGAGMGYHRAGFEVVGVDIKPRPHYPFEFHQADALEYLAEHGQEFDAIHASPPCQAFTAMQHIMKNANAHPDLVDKTRQALVVLRKPWAIENVVGAPLRVDVMLCGSMFGIQIIRHRIFESSVTMPLLMPTCHHDKVYDPWHGIGWYGKGKERTDNLRNAMGIDWPMSLREVYEAIPPAYTEFIGRIIAKEAQAV
jgi:DNA (cytosine-5)-methyltransferase 1